LLVRLTPNKIISENSIKIGDVVFHIPFLAKIKKLTNT